MLVVNMRSLAHTVKGQGVGACYEEHVALIRDHLGEEFIVCENKNTKCDITHYHTVNLRYFFHRLLSGKRSVSVCFVHFLPETIEGSIKLPWLFRTVFYKYILVFYNSMDYLVAVNPTIIAKAREAGVNKPKLSYIPNYVSETNFYEFSAADKLEARRRYGIDGDKFVVLGVGQLQTRKGIFDFFETAKRLSHIQFMWAGGFSFGKMTDGYAEIKNIVDNPPENIKFLGIVDRSEMPAIYNICDLMFLPSFDELFPMSILEAMCCKKPILLRDIPVYESILGESYLKGRDAGEFCDCIEQIAADKKLYEKWTNNSWNCHLKYNKESIAAMWRELYTAAYDRREYAGPTVKSVYER